MLKDKKHIQTIRHEGPMGFILFLAWFGALVYFINHANGFWEVVLAFLQACVWPALVIYKVLELLALG